MRNLPWVLLVVFFSAIGFSYAVQQGGTTIGDNIFASLTVANTGLHIRDTGGDHDLIIVPGTDLGADRQFTITTGDAARVFTLADDLTVAAGAGDLNQDLSSDATDVTFGSMNLGGGTFELPNGTDLPATCDPTTANVFLDTNDDSCADANDGSGCLCICISANTWAPAT